MDVKLAPPIDTSQLRGGNTGIVIQAEEDIRSVAHDHADSTGNDGERIASGSPQRSIRVDEDLPGPEVTEMKESSQLLSVDHAHAESAPRSGDNDTPRTGPQQGKATETEHEGSNASPVPSRRIGLPEPVPSMTTLDHPVYHKTLPTTSTLYLPPGVEMTIQEINGEPNPNDPTVETIQWDVLKMYQEEEHRRQLEREVKLREREIERAKDEDRIIKGLDNEDFNALLRSFDKHVQDVHAVPPPYDGHIPRGLDLHPHPDEEFSVHKLNAALERFYASVVVGFLRAGHEIQRIRHWEDGGQRTLIALTVYTYAWWCDLTLTTILLFLTILIFSPSSRSFFFHPPVQLPDDDKPPDATRIAEGRQQNQYGLANSEARATSWAQNVQSLAETVATPSKGNKEATKLTQTAQEAVEGRLQVDMSKREDAGNLNEGDEELSRKDKAIKLYAQPGMRMIGGLADKWERIANALSPAQGNELFPYRLEVFVYLVLPLICITTFVPAWIFSKAAGAVFGFILFAQPLMTYVIDELDRNIPDWKERLILEWNILETVPTNSQLVLYILRKAEKTNKPVPPAPLIEHDSEGEDEDETDDDGGEGNGMKGMKKKMGKTTGKVKHGARTKARHAWDRIGRMKEEAFATLAGRKQIDYEGKAEHAMDKLHIDKDHGTAAKVLHKLPSAPDDEDISRFYVWHERHGPGHIVIHPADAMLPARIEFTTVKATSAQNAPLDPLEEPSKGHLIVPINNIVGIKKIGMNLPGRTALGWALDAEGAGGTGMEIRVVRRDQEEAVEPVVKGEETVAQGKEEVIKLSGIVRRNELFDRLIAIGDQRWELH